MKYLSIIGTRPQYIKILDNLKNHVIADTRQHYDDDMSDVFVKQLKIKIKYKLGTTELGDMIKKCSEVIAKENPDVVIVYGDTRSTLAGALSAKFANKTLAHVESGMRSKDMSQPEELIRVIVDRISDYKFCANKFALNNLIKESLSENSFVVGDPMWDNLNKILPIPKSKDFEEYNLITLHRQQNIENEQGLRDLFSALEESKERFIFPIHPRTKRVLKKFNIKIPKNVEVIKPQGYKEMIKLETNCKKVLTDSGGVQRECYWFCKPVIILRWETEWQEIVEDGWGVLVGLNKKQILDALKNHNPSVKVKEPKYLPLFGAKQKIAQYLQ